MHVFLFIYIPQPLIWDTFSTYCHFLGRAKFSHILNIGQPYEGFHVGSLYQKRRHQHYHLLLRFTLSVMAMNTSDHIPLLKEALLHATFYRNSFLSLPPSVVTNENLASFKSSIVEYGI